MLTRFSFSKLRPRAPFVHETAETPTTVQAHNCTSAIRFKRTVLSIFKHTSFQKPHRFDAPLERPASNYNKAPSRLPVGPSLLVLRKREPGNLATIASIFITQTTNHQHNPSTTRTHQRAGVAAHRFCASRCCSLQTANKHEVETRFLTYRLSRTPCTLVPTTIVAHISFGALKVNRSIITAESPVQRECFSCHCFKPTPSSSRPPWDAVMSLTLVPSTSSPTAFPLHCLFLVNLATPITHAETSLNYSRNY